MMNEKQTAIVRSWHLPSPSLNHVSKIVPLIQQEKSARLNVWFPSLSNSLMSRKNANSEMNGRLNEILGQSGSLHNS